MLTKKHYQEIIKIMAKNKYKGHNELLNDLMKYFEADNPRFNSKLFFKAYCTESAKYDVEQIETLFQKAENGELKKVEGFKKTFLAQ